MKIKNKELLLKKKEEIVDICSTQVKLTSEIESVFDLWYENFDKHYDPTKIRVLQSEVDGNVSKLHLIINLYLPEMENFIEQITHETDEFLEICADYSMAAKLGKEDYLKLNQIDIIEASNKCAVSFMFLSSNLTRLSRQEF